MRFTNLSIDSKILDTRAKRSFMFQPVNLDEREQLIFDSADHYWATRMLGRGVRTRLGPFKTQDEAYNGIMSFFKAETDVAPFVAAKPFLLYAASTVYGQSHVCLGSIHRDGSRGVTHKEVSLRLQEERKRARSSSSRN